MKSVSQIPDKEKLFSYERTACFGYCPMYEVVVLKNGKSYFIGKRFVPLIDTVSFILSEVTFRQIKAILNHPEYLHLTIEEPEYHITDIPGLNFTDYQDKRHYELDQIIPDPITAITERIDDVLESIKLLYHDKTYPMVRQEILLQLKPGMDPYSLDGQKHFYQLNYRRALGENIYLYEIIVAEDKMEEALRTLKQQQDVIEIQKNHSLERR